MTDDTSTGNEHVIGNAAFTPGITSPWLKASFNLTSKRVSGSVPNLILGLFPVGTKEFTYPLKNISGVMVSTKLHLSRLFFGLFFVLLGLALLEDSFFFGLLITLFGALSILNCYTSTFLISNNAGNNEGYQLSILDKNSVKEFVDKINNTVAEV